MQVLTHPCGRRVMRKRESRLAHSVPKAAHVSQYVGAVGRGPGCSEHARLPDLSLATTLCAADE